MIANLSLIIPRTGTSSENRVTAFFMSISVGLTIKKLFWKQEIAWKLKEIKEENNISARNPVKKEVYEKWFKNDKLVRDMC